jgi:hypothetical protein
LTKINTKTPKQNFIVVPPSDLFSRAFPPSDLLAGKFVNREKCFVSFVSYKSERGL